MAKGKAKRAANAGVIRGYDGPLATVRDPATRVEVALHGDDRGTPELLRRTVEHLAEFLDEDALPFPLKRVDAVVDGRRQSVSRKRDGIDLMHEKETIGDRELVAAREFEAAFAISNQVRFGTMDPGRVGGGGMAAEDFIARRIRASDKVDEMIDWAGGVGSHAALAVERIAGRGWTLRRMQSQYGQSTHYWRGVFVVGLQTIVHRSAKEVRKSAPCQLTKFTV